VYSVQLINGAIVTSPEGFPPADADEEPKPDTFNP